MDEDKTPYDLPPQPKDFSDTTIVKNVFKTVKQGIGFGSCLAMVISYVTWKSIGWAIVHGMLGWIYVVYFFFRHN